MELEVARIQVRDEPLSALTETLGQALKSGSVQVEAPYHPTHTERSDRPLFEGELYRHGAQRLRYRSLRAWLELAEVLNARLTLLELAQGTLTLLLTPVSGQAGWHQRALPSGHPEKYGAESDYHRVEKLEEPLLARDLERALWLARPQGLSRALAVGCNKGEELELLRRCLARSEVVTPCAELIGVDHSESALEVARCRYPDPLLTFERADLRDLCPERYGRLELLMALNVLHSPSLDGHTLFKRWVKGLLSPKASVIVGLPNCRYQGSALRYGAVTPHSGGQDLAQLITEAQFYLRYLRQQGFNTFVVGQYQLLIIGRKG